MVGVVARAKNICLTLSIIYIYIDICIYTLAPPTKITDDFWCCPCATQTIDSKSIQKFNENQKDIFQVKAKDSPQSFVFCFLVLVTIRRKHRQWTEKLMTSMCKHKCGAIYLSRCVYTIFL